VERTQGASGAAEGDERKVTGATYEEAEARCHGARILESQTECVGA